MASINYAAREISVKIVYYGPGLSGKTTNLQVIHRKVPPEYKSDMVSLATETDRTLFFDFLPLDLGKIKGFSTKFQLYTVPGQVYYNATRKLVLRGVDGVVFVADSAPDKVQENLESFQNLEENLAEYGYKRDNVPIIIQYNKRDLPNAMSIEELQQLINMYNLPWSEAVANKGKGVFDSLKLIGKIVIDYLNKKYSRGTRTSESTAHQAAQPQNRFSAGQQQNPNQFPNFAPQQPIKSQPFQQPYHQSQNMDFPPQSQLRPPKSPQLRQPQQPLNGPQSQGRMAPPPASTNPRPMQPAPFGLNQGTQQGPNVNQKQNSGYFPPPPIQQQQNLNSETQSQQYFPQKQDSEMPLQSKLPIQKPQEPPISAENKFEFDPFDNSQSYVPQAPMEIDNDQINVNQSNFADYSSFNLEPMENPPAQNIYDKQQSEVILEPNDQEQAFLPSESVTADFNQNQFNRSEKTDLDLEIEKYQREIEEKQKRNRVQPGLQPQQSEPKSQMPFFDSQQDTSNTQLSSNITDLNDYDDIYNMEMPSFAPIQNNQPTQKEPIAGMDEGDDAMFFTSVDPDRPKKPVKKPVVNPATSKDQQQQKGFLSKFFNRDAP